MSGLIVTDRHTPADLAEWERLRRRDRVVARSTCWERLQQAAREELRRFRPDYIGCSWGKDSIVLAHLCWTLWADNGPPLVWVRNHPRDNPDCRLVRDAFLADFPMPYEETTTCCTPRPDGTWLAPAGRLSLSAGFRLAAERFGPRYASGVRAEESSVRRKRVGKGLATSNTLAPIGRWSTAQVFAYLLQFSLPVHPAYGYTQGGIWDRDRLRVAGLAGGRGTGRGRAEWERLYYGDRLREIETMAREACS
ncbi:MAG: hypothetical protein AB7S38_29125 [Vulcanimicrobiota bacterium]